MWRCPKASVIVIFTVTMTFSAAPAEAGRPCPYWVLVSREGFPQENIARVCDEDQMGTILRWMRVADAAVSRRAPQAPLNDGFTVTIGVMKAGQELLAPVDRSAVLTVRVYPVAASGPAAFVPARTLFLRRVCGMAIARRERSGADGTHGPRDAPADTEAHDAHPYPASHRAHYQQSPRTRHRDAALPTRAPRCRGSCRQAKHRSTSTGDPGWIERSRGGPEP